MKLTRGDRLGPYEILDLLGAGGMGEVYRAHDPRLDREVAIKVLPDGVADDANALARFEREAKAVAALSHPNILGIFDFSAEGSLHYAVMELLLGQTVRVRLARGKPSIAKALDIAAQVAEGLAAAHAQGVVHRDLKPENLFVTEDGRVKILDFGLARQASALSGLGTDTQSPTMTQQTDPGTVLGTVGYMSPEQVRGEPADERSDIFSLGVVLYELLTGERAFTRETAVETMTAILREEPDVPSSSGVLPPDLLPLIRRCLEKQPRQRFQSAGDLAFALRRVHTDSDVTTAVGSLRRDPRPRRAIGPWLLAGAALMVGLAVGGSRIPEAPGVSVPKISPLTYSGRDWSPSASPDGRTVAYTSDRDGRPRIWLRQLATGSERPITDGPDDAASFSPDGESILFSRSSFSDRGQALYRVPLLGGTPRRIADDSSAAAWSPDGTQIVSVRFRTEEGVLRSHLELIAVDGGSRRVLASLDHVRLHTPHWSSDGQWIAVGEQGVVSTQNRILIFDLEGQLRHTIQDSEVAGGLSAGLWLDARNLLVSSSPGLAAGQRGEVGAIQQVELGVPGARTILWVNNLQPGVLSAIPVLARLPEGRLLFDTTALRQRLVEVPLDGQGGGTVRELTSGMSRDRQPIYSADGQEVIFSSNRSGNLDLWAVHRESRTLRRLTEHPTEDWDPALSPDGEHLLWSSSRSGNLEIWMSRADGTGGQQISQDGYDAENPTMTADGQFIVYVSNNPETQGFWRVRADGSEPIRITARAGVLPEVSPDGRWFLFSNVASNAATLRFASVETGAVLPLTLDVVQGELTSSTLSQTSLGRARWSPDGRGVYYIGADEAGHSGVFFQSFDPAATQIETAPQRIVGFAPGQAVESLGVSRDGRLLTYSISEQSRQIMIAEGLAL